MLDISELENRWFIFDKNYRDFSVLEIFLLFSLDNLSSDWTDQEKRQLLENVRIWSFPSPQFGNSFFLEKILEVLLNNYYKNEYLETISQKNHWVEQWCLYGIENKIIPTYKYDELAKKLKERGFLHSSETILLKMIEEKRTTVLLQMVVACFISKKQYGKAIYYQKIVIERSKNLTPELFFDQNLEFINCLLLRNGQYSKDIKDNELAYSLIEQHYRQGHKRIEYLKQQVESALTFNCFKKNDESSNFEKIMLSINRLNFNTSHRYFGGNGELPYHHDLVGSAPLALTYDEVKKYFQRHNHLSESFHHVLKKRNLVDDTILNVSTVSALMLWNYSQIDTTVLDALSFSSASHPLDFFDIQKVGSSLSEGAMTRLSGYVAEQQVALNLQQQGYHVQFPDKANQQGFDLLVDGHPMQVKCTLSEGYVREHLNNNPDIPVIVNRELASVFENHPNVIIDDQLSYSIIKDSTEASIQHLEQFGSMTELMFTPLVTVLFSAHRHYFYLKQGTYSTTDFAINTIVDSSARLGGVLLCKSIGFSVGSFLGPVGAIIGATAGVYLGSVFSASKSDQLLKPHVTEQGKKVSLLLKEFAEWFLENVIEARNEMNKNDFKKYPLQMFNPQENIEDEKIILMHFRFLQSMKLKRLEALEQYLKCLINKSFAHAVQAGWICVENSNHFYHPELNVWLKKINAEIQVYQDYVLQPNVNLADLNQVIKS